MPEGTCLPVHIICQAHIDPVWIWDWPEGLSKTLATFETAADLLDEYPDFVFNHNESVLYEWTLDFRPELLLLNWNERRRAAQLELSTSIGGGDYEVEIPHATVRRPRNNGEEPMGRWLTLTDGERSLALVNDGPGGVEVAGRKVRQTLVRSATYCSGNDAVETAYLGEHMDLGEHIYHFRLLFGALDAVVAERQLATDDLTLPLSYHCSLPLDGSDRPGLPAGTPSVQLDRLHGEGRVHLEAMKVSEDGAGLVVRLAERAGASATARLEVPGAASMELAFRGYEMKTLRVERGGSLRECELLER